MSDSSAPGGFSRHETFQDSYINHGCHASGGGIINNFQFSPGEALENFNTYERSLKRRMTNPAAYADPSRSKRQKLEDILRMTLDIAKESTDYGNPLEAKTPLEASKLALKALHALTSLIPYGTALSDAIKGLLAVVEAVEEKYENEGTFKDLNDRLHQLIPIIDELHATHRDELRQFLNNLRKSFDELRPTVEAVKNQASFVQFISGKNNAYCDESWKKLDTIINDAEFVLKVDIRNHQKLEAQRTAFLRLHPPCDTTFNSDMRTQSECRSCLKDTCVEVLEKIHKWVESDAGSLFWLHGPAGSGKSTVAQTIAEGYSHGTVPMPNQTETRLAASFFFSRGYLTSSDILFQAIAFQLGQQHSILKEVIATAIVDDPTILYRKGNQLKTLILDPISKMASFLPSRLVVVIDALDECDSDAVASHLIKLLATSLSSFTPPLPLRFLVTSRPEKRLYDFFIRSPTSFDAFGLDPSNITASQDISRYITHELGRLGRLSSTDIDHLVRISEGLFIAASTIVRFLKPSPMLRLKKVQSHGLSGLDDLYKLIVESAMKELLPDSDEQGSFRLIIAAIILASARLTMKALFDLLQLDLEIKDLVLDGLRSVINVPGPDTLNNVVHAFHSSFHDFLINPKHRKETWFIDSAKYHGILARSCLERMDRLLKMDICHLQKHTKKNRDGKVRKEVKSLPGDLVYASRYWATHFAKSKQDDSELLALLNRFALKHLLHWIEILCLLDCLSEGVGALQITIKRVKPSTNVSRKLIRLLSDAVHFLTDFHGLLSISAMHTYVTALPLSPRDSAIYKHYGEGLKYLRMATTYHEREWFHVPS